MTLIRDHGFAPEDWPHGFTENPREIAGENGAGLDLPPDATLEQIAGRLPSLRLIRIDFPSFADGRGFTLARQLRLMGYRGRLRAAGHLSPINTLWRGGQALTKWKSQRPKPGVSQRRAGSFVPIGRRMTTKPAYGADLPFT